MLYCFLYKIFMVVVKAECRPAQNTEIEIITFKCLFGFRIRFGNASVSVFCLNLFSTLTLLCYSISNSLNFRENALIYFILHFILLFLVKMHSSGLLCKVPFYFVEYIEQLFNRFGAQHCDSCITEVWYALE